MFIFMGVSYVGHPTWVLALGDGSFTSWLTWLQLWARGHSCYVMMLHSLHFMLFFPMNPHTDTTYSGALHEGEWDMQCYDWLLFRIKGQYLAHESFACYVWKICANTCSSLYTHFAWSVSSGQLTCIVFWHSANVTVLKYDTRNWSTEAVAVGALYITAYNHLFQENKISKNDFFPPSIIQHSSIVYLIIWN